VPQHRLREDEIPVEVDVEDAARPGNDLDGIQNCFPFLQDPRDQTGRVRERASGDAVLDPDTMVRSHRSIVLSLGLCFGGEVMPLMDEAVRLFTGYGAEILGPPLSLSDLA
jgi:hypothetical protein